MRVPILTVAALMCIPNTSAATSPATALRAALADARALPPIRAAQVRYVSAYNCAPSDLEAWRAALDYAVNAVSRTAAIRRCGVVDGTGGRLFRLDMASYGFTVGTWESLARDDEPYWHVTTKVADPTTGKVGTVMVDAGHVGLAEATALRTMTGSAAPIVRLDWFVCKVAQPPHYYAMAGVPEKVDDWYAGVGADRNKIVSLRANHGANLFQSGVTRKTRRLSRYSGPLGGVWQTYDSDGKDPLKDPIRNPSFAAGFDASELIAAKPNGLHLYGLYDSAGKRQDAVPDVIAKDDSDPHGDGRLVPMVSCVRCHGAAGESGLRSFTNDTKALLERGVDILTGSPFDAESLANFYLSDKLERDLARDREDYAVAVKKATGLDPTRAAAALAAVFRDYEYATVGPEKAKVELNASSLDGLRYSTDGVLLGVMAGQRVPRRSWERGFAEAARLLNSAR